MADIRDIIEQMEERLARAFYDAVVDIQSSAELRKIERALTDGRIDDALRALHIDQAVFAPMAEELRQAYIAAGRQAISGLPALTDPRNATRVVVRFEVGNPRAESFLATQSGNLIREITQDQLNGTRRILSAAMAQGQGSRRTALDLVGRIDRITGRRSGGLIGLLNSEKESVIRAKLYLRDNDPAYFALKSRDRRFDGMIARAWAGKRAPLTEDQISKIGGRYADTLLRTRGERIARTEIRRATHAGADEAMRQVVDTGAVRPHHIRKVWHATPDSRTRDAHRALSGTSVGLDEPFISPRTNAPLMYPGDSSNAPAEDVVNCRCWMQHRVDFLANLAEEEGLL